MKFKPEIEFRRERDSNSWPLRYRVQYIFKLRRPWTAALKSTSFPVLFLFQIPGNGVALQYVIVIVPMVISSYSCFLGLWKSNGHSREKKTNFSERFPCAIASSSGLKFALGFAWLTWPVVTVFLEEHSCTVSVTCLNSSEVLKAKLDIELQQIVIIFWRHYA